MASLSPEKRAKYSVCIRHTDKSRLCIRWEKRLVDERQIQSCGPPWILADISVFTGRAGRPLTAGMSNERTPLIPSGVCGLTVSAACLADSEATPESGHGSPSKDPRKLNTFFGVMVPTVLSMFSIVLFLRTGEQRLTRTVDWLQPVDVYIYDNLSFQVLWSVMRGSCRVF